MHKTRRQLLQWTGGGLGAAMFAPFRMAFAISEPDRVLAVSCLGGNAGPMLTLVHAETLQVLATLPSQVALAYPASRWAFGRDLVWGGIPGRVVGINAATGTIGFAADTRSNLNQTELTPDGRFVLCAAAGTDKVLKIDADPDSPTAGHIVETADHYPGANPSDLTMLADGSYCFTADRGGDTVSVFQVDPLRKVVTVPLERGGTRALEPIMATVSPRGDYLFVETARGSGGELVLDISNPMRPFEVKRFEQVDGLGTNPASNEFSPDGRFSLIVNRNSADLTVVDADLLQIRGRVALPDGSAPMTGTFAPEGTRFFVPLSGRDTVAVVNVPEFEVTQFIAVGPKPVGIAYLETAITR